MSLTATIWAWAQVKRCAHPSVHHVLLALANRARDNGRCWPSQAVISEDTGLSARTVVSALQRLESAEIGLIQRRKRFRSGTKGGSDMIQLMLSPVTIYAEGIPTDDDADWNEADYEAPTSATIAEMTRGSGADFADMDGATRQTAAQSHATIADRPAATVAHQPVRTQPVREGEQRTEEERKNISNPETGVQNPARGLAGLALTIFSLSMATAQERTGGDPSRIEGALRAAQNRGEDPVEVAEAVMAYVTHEQCRKDGGKYAPGPHKVIEDGRWRHWIGKPQNGGRQTTVIGSKRKDVCQPDPSITEVTWEGRTYKVPPGGQTHPIGTNELPGVALQIHAMEMWPGRKNLSDWDNLRYGPPPGHPDCRFWPEVLSLYPHESLTNRRDFSGKAETRTVA